MTGPAGTAGPDMQNSRLCAAGPVCHRAHDRKCLLGAAGTRDAEDTLAALTADPRAAYVVVERAPSPLSVSPLGRTRYRAAS